MDDTESIAVSENKQKLQVAADVDNGSTLEWRDNYELSVGYFACSYAFGKVYEYEIKEIEYIK